MYQKIRFPETVGDRHEADLPRGERAAGPRGDRVRRRQQAQERDPGAQGQHHEVHRGRLPQLGLRPGRARVRRPDLHLGPVGADQGPEGRGRGQRRAEGRPGRGQGARSRTPSPTSPCSRSSPGPPSSTSSPRPTSTAIIFPTPWRPRWAASASRRGATSTTSPATPSSRPPTAPRPSMPTSTRSIPAPSSSPAR